MLIGITEIDSRRHLDDICKMAKVKLSSGGVSLFSCQRPPDRVKESIREEVQNHVGSIRSRADQVEESPDIGMALVATVDPANWPKPLTDEQLWARLRLEAESHEAAVWVLIMAFIGLAIGSSSGWFAPWLGALGGGALALLVSAEVITRMHASNGA